MQNVVILKIQMNLFHTVYFPMRDLDVHICGYKEYCHKSALKFRSFAITCKLQDSCQLPTNMPQCSAEHILLKHY